MGTLTGSILGGNWVTNVIGGICLTIDYIVYLAINLCYQLFEVVGKIEVFSTDSVAEISHKIYTIIGIVMLFVFAYNIILGIIDPDSINKGDKSVQNVVKNTVISVVLITLFPLICEYMQTFQNHVVEDKTITNLILGSTASDKSALSISTTIFTAFYHPLDENKSPVTLAECETSPEKAKLCPKYSELAGEAKNSLSGLWNLMHDSDFRYGIGDDTMEYLFPLSTIAGVVAAYLFLSFSLDLGVRAAKLGALKLVAPIPIFLRITKPKGGQFDKWLSEFIKTYLQVFERIIIISFAMLLISYVSSIDITKNLFTNNDPSVTEPSVFIKLLAIVVVILGILKFAKDAPKLIEDLFNVKIPQMSLKKKINDNEYALRGASMLGGAGATAIGNVLKARKEGKGGGEVLKTGLGGLIGGGRQGWVQSRGLNDINKLKDTIVGARATANQNRDEREAQTRDLQNRFIEEKRNELRSQLKAEHPEWNEEQLTLATNAAFNEIQKDRDFQIARSLNGSAPMRFKERVVNKGAEFKKYMSEGGAEGLQRSVSNQTELKNSVKKFLDIANKDKYKRIKDARDSISNELTQGKLSPEKLAERLRNSNSNIRFKPEVNAEGNIMTNDNGEVIMSNHVITLNGVDYDLNNKEAQADAIKAAFAQEMSDARADNLKGLNKGTCENFAKALSEQFESIKYTIDEDSRNSLSDQINNLVITAQSLNETSPNSAFDSFAALYKDLDDSLTTSINSTVLNSMNKKDK